MKYLSSFKNKNLANKICLLRSDFNIEDTDLHGYENGLTRIPPLRISAILPTIQFLLKGGAKVVILSHRGRPEINLKSPASAKAPAGRQISNLKNFSLKPFAKILSKLLKKPVRFIDFDKKTNFIKAEEVRKIRASINGSIVMLENLRFFPEEEKNDKKFAKKLASLGDFYVNDAFSVSHRKDASVVAITKFLASYAGFCLENEIKNLSRVMHKQKKPLVIILGGAKIPDKIEALKNFMKKADKILIGGDYEKEIPFLSKFEKSRSRAPKENKFPTGQASSLRGKVILPVDYIREKGKIWDIGPKTSFLYSEIIKNAKTIIWNGPMGYIENPKFSKGTEAIIEAIIKSRALAIIGGGETIASLNISAESGSASGGKNQIRPFGDSSKTKIKNNVFLSTGGGAMLEYLAGKKLPGIAALK